VGRTLIKPHKLFKMKLTVYLLILSSFCLFAGCAKEEEINNSETQVGHSKVIFFPSIEIKGDHVIILQQGETFTDPGATAILNGQPVQYATAGTVNTSTPGIYYLTYEAKNAEGYSASDYRSVAVIGNDVSDARDLSGTYARYVGGSANGQTSTWTKTAKGVYTVVNPGGATGVTAIAVNYTGNRIAIPPQPTSAGQFSTAITSESGIYYPDALPPYYEWAIVNGGYGPALRTFKKL
jgi:hypothetical protein